MLTLKTPKVTKTFKVTRINPDALTPGEQIVVTEAKGYTEASQRAIYQKQRNPTHSVFIMIELHAEGDENASVPRLTSNDSN